MKKIILALALLTIAAPAARGESAFGIAWNPAVAIGNTSDFASGLSLRGMTGEWRNFSRPDVALGASVGWLVFNEDFSGTVTEGGLTVTGKQWNTINTVPIHVTAYKYFGSDRRDTRMFAGLGAGTNWMEYTTELGSYVFKEDRWHIALAPEIGLQLPWDSFMGYVSVRWQYAFASGDFDAQSWFDFKIGFGLD